MGSIWTIRRSRTDHIVSGLCGGLAARWGIDAMIVRVAYALLALSGGIGLVLYAAGWLLIPVDGQDKAPIDDLLGERAARVPREAWIAIVAVACVLFLGLSGPVVPFGFGPALVLAAIWYFGRYRPRLRDKPEHPGPGRAGPDQSADPQDLDLDRLDPRGGGFDPRGGGLDPQTKDGHDQQTIPGPATPFTEATRAWQARVHRAYQGGADQGAAEEAPAPVQAPMTAPADGDQLAFFAHPDPVGIFTAPTPGLDPDITAGRVTARPIALSRRGDSPTAKRLRWISALVLGLVLSGLGIADALGLAVPLEGYFAAALLVVALTLVLAAFVGRARGLLLAGFVVLMGLALSSASATVSDLSHLGVPQIVSYATLDEMPASYRHHVGRVEVDLRQVTVSKDQTFTSALDAGSLEVRISPGQNVRIEYGLGVGSFDILGTAGGGPDVHGVKEQLPNPGQPVLTLKLRAGTGRVMVS